jgi:gliding motility-associated-like protein
MMLKKQSIFYLILIFVFFAGQLDAQSFSDPCARILVGGGQDSVTWSAQPCANFGGYVIFATADTNPSTPLLPVDTVTNANQFGVAISNLTETPRFYQLGMICGGSISITSIIFSNQRPITPNILSVDLYTGQPVLSWNPSPTPNVIGYQIYKEDPYGSGNYFPYPSNNQIITALSFTDVNATDLLVRYQIAAVTPCNEGLRSEGTALDGTTGPHSSILLEYNIDSCTREITLNWNPYENWADGVSNYEIWMEVNGGTAQLLTTTTNTSYIYNGAQDGDNLTFWIEAQEANANNSARTNQVNFNASVNRPMNFLQLTNVTVDNNATAIEINWRWDTDTDFGQAWLQRSTDGQSWENRITITTQNSVNNGFLDTEVDVNANRYYYRVLAEDQCGNQTTSNYGSTILLTGEAQENYNNELVWTPLDYEYAHVIYYDVYKVVSNIDNRLVRADSADNLYLDKVDVNIEAEANSCYYIQAEARLIFPDGSQRFLISRSNNICLEQQAVLWFPNAFAPEGRNKTFRPKVAYGQTLTNYQLQIFDRYGGQLFSTTDIDAGWDGLKNGKPLPQGIYVFISNYTLADGTSNQERGTIMLLR